MNEVVIRLRFQMVT